MLFDDGNPLFCLRQFLGRYKTPVYTPHMSSPLVELWSAFLFYFPNKFCKSTSMKWRIRKPELWFSRNKQDESQHSLCSALVLTSGYVPHFSLEALGCLEHYFSCQWQKKNVCQWMCTWIIFWFSFCLYSTFVFWYYPAVFSLFFYPCLLFSVSLFTLPPKTV